MSYCRFCGNQLKGDEIFCSNCGKKTSDDNSAQQSRNVQRENFQQKSPTYSESYYVCKEQHINHSSVRPIIAGILLVLSLLFGVINDANFFDLAKGVKLVARFSDFAGFYKFCCLSPYFTIALIVISFLGASGYYNYIIKDIVEAIVMVSTVGLVMISYQYMLFPKLGPAFWLHLIGFIFSISCRKVWKKVKKVSRDGIGISNEGKTFAVSYLDSTDETWECPKCLTVNRGISCKVCGEVKRITER